MEKELTLPEVFRLLSEGKKVRNDNWRNISYIYFVDNVLKNSLGTGFSELNVDTGHWYEYVIPPFKFDDLVAGKVYKTNLNAFIPEVVVECKYPYTYKVVYATHKYACIEDVQTNNAFVIYRGLFPTFQQNEKFYIEETNQ